MTNWILILTLTTQNPYKTGQPSTAIESIQGFKTQDKYDKEKKKVINKTIKDNNLTSIMAV